MKKNRFLLFVAIACLIAGGIFAYLSFGQHDNLNNEERLVRQIREDVVASETDANSSMIDYLHRRIDFEKLQKINPDVQRWVFMPNTNIDYYVMQEPVEGVCSYLYVDINKEKNDMGSILTMKVPEEDAHLIIYGHHMRIRDHAFANLTDFNDEEHAKKNKYVYVYYPDHSECWELWCAGNTTKNTPVYMTPYELGTNDYQDLIDYIGNNIATYEISSKPDKYTKMLVLSTCHREAGDQNTRFVNIYSPVFYYFYDEDKLVNAPEYDLKDYKQKIIKQNKENED